MNPTTFPFVLIVGPTASGKSALGATLAAKYNGAILNCDSLQFYKRLDVGTAKPSPQDRAAVPHLLFDIAGPGEVLTAGDFRRLALAELDRELPHRPVFGVGGSGFYIQALEKGVYDLPKPRVEIEAAVRLRLQEEGLAALYNELKIRDPEYGNRLNPHDAYRITRALIIIEDSGKTVTEVRRAFQPQPFPFPLLKLGLDPGRSDLRARIESRTAKMLSAGLVDEARELLAEGWEDWPPLKSVGYKECLLFLGGEIGLSQLPGLISEKTMQLSKRQRTWFKRDDEIHWLPSHDPLSDALQLVGNFMVKNS